MAFDEGIDDSINEYGESVVIRSIPRDNYNKWGDLNESSTSTDRTTIAVPNILSNADLEVQEGKFSNGDKRFFFKTDERNMSSGNRIQHDSKWYEIEDVMKHRLQGEIAAFETLARKV